MTESVKARFPLSQNEDAIFSFRLDLNTENRWLCDLFPGTGNGASTAAFEKLFSNRICHGIGHRTLRKWELGLG